MTTLRQELIRTILAVRSANITSPHSVTEAGIQAFDFIRAKGDSLIATLEMPPGYHALFLHPQAPPKADAVDAERMDWLERHAVEVRMPMLHGSQAMFHAQAINEDHEEYRNDLRNQIDSSRSKS